MESILMKCFTNTLSTLTILACVYLKVPQIIQIIKNGNTEGIYLMAVVMEVIGYTISFLYNYLNRYSFITYMEYPIVLVQLYALSFCLLKCRGMFGKLYVTLLILTYIVVVVAFPTETFDKIYLSYMIQLVTPLSGFSKLTYIYGMVEVDNADAVSLTTWIISILTNIARMFTVYMDSGDLKLITNFAVSTVLSTCVLSTAMFMQTRPKLDLRPHRN